MVQSASSATHSARASRLEATRISKFMCAWNGNENLERGVAL